MIIGNGSPCNDCGTPTTPPNNRINPKQTWEYYMVHNKLWRSVTDPTFYFPSEPKKYLCIGCLEIRIGRLLTPEDFTLADINNDNQGWSTPRLRNRLGLP
jgi:hypothetical protein